VREARLLFARQCVTLRSVTRFARNPPPFQRVLQQRCYSHGRDTQHSFAVHEVRKVISTARAQFLLALCHSQGYYSYGKGTVPLPCATRTDVIRTERCYFAPCRVQRGRTLSARKGVILPLAVCNVKGIIGTAQAYFLLALRQPRGYYSYGCRVQRGRTFPARQGVILPLALCKV